jgi:hypothetical protein
MKVRTFRQVCFVLSRLHSRDRRHYILHRELMSFDATFFQGRPVLFNLPDISYSELNFLQLS